MLSERWEETWRGLDRTPPAGVVDFLLRAYDEPSRAYHTTQHLEECFGHLDACPVEPQHRGRLELALWFHDAVYETKASDNEARSAALARTELADLPETELDEIEALILATAHTSAPQAGDQQLLVDIDLAILGASHERFEEYEVQVREEYRWVPGLLYRSGRRKILRGILARDSIYGTAHFRDSFELRARENLERSIAQLSS